MCLPLTSGVLCGSFGLKTICSFGGLEKAGDAVTAFRLARCGCEALALSVVPVALLFTAMHADVRPHVREAVQTLPPRILWLFLKVFFCFFLVFNYFSSAVDPPPPIHRRTRTCGRWSCSTRCRGSAPRWPRSSSMSTTATRWRT